MSKYDIITTPPLTRREIIIYFVCLTVSFVICFLAMSYPVEKEQQIHNVAYITMATILLISMSILILMHVNRHRLVIVNG